MNKYLKLLCVFLIITIIEMPCMPNILGEQNTRNITILFTNDMHDHMLPSYVELDGNILSSGGYARLKSAINNEKEIDNNALLVDAGDFSMGTLFQSLYSSDAPELRIMGQMGYDAVTLGNHEFDFRGSGFADCLNAAKNSGDKLPQIVQANMSFPTENQGELSQSLEKIKQATENYGVKEYTVVEKNGVKIGVFGLMGEDSAYKAPMSEVKFTDEVDTAKRIVDKLKQEEKVDMIVCLSHSGLWKDDSKSKDESKAEDELLAKKVPDINVIISGHTHTTLKQPIVVGKTIIASTGEYCSNLGVMKISQDSNKDWILNSCSLKPIDSSLSEDGEILKTIDKFKNIVQEKYLNDFGVKFDEILAKSSFSFLSNAERYKKHDEDMLGNLISDAYKYAVQKSEGEKYEEIAATIVPIGTIRGSFVKGYITVSDVFTVSSLGVGADKKSGYPLISVYLTGKELKTACEVDASISPIMQDAQLYMSGINFTFNPNRLIFNKVENVNLKKPDGAIENIDDSRLYRVVVGLYTAQMLSIVGDKSFGLMSIVPKTKDGTPITDFEKYIITDNINGHSTEVKEWFAIAEYLKSFDKTNGVPQVPQYYNEIQGRKIVDNDNNIVTLLKNPNKITIMLYGVIGVIITIIITIVIFIRKRLKKIKSLKVS